MKKVALISIRKAISRDFLPLANLFLKYIPLLIIQVLKLQFVLFNFILSKSYERKRKIE
jgi:hypothetical protein